jgi:acyl CoA:acetate/3-ketoacid CoA transferase
MRTELTTGIRVESARAAVDGIADGETVAILGAGGGVGEPDLLIAALGERFDETGHPSGLTLVHAFGLGDRGDRGLTPIARAGLVRRVIGGHWGQTPAMARLAQANEIEAYNLPLGVMTQLHREIAGGRPGLITRVGLGTFVDPRVEGGRLNDRTHEQIVDVLELDGEEYLFYRGYRIDTALIRGVSGDRHGNVSLVGDVAFLDVLALAGAAHASGGRVIAQVKSILPDGEQLSPLQVKVPGVLVDMLVEHPDQHQTYEAEDNRAYAGLERVDLAQRAPMALGPRKVIARRATALMHPGAIANVGVGVPDGVGLVLAEEQIERDATLTVEHGIVGGVSAQGALFGASVNFGALLDTPSMIDFYHGGGLDFAFLGFAEVDRLGNVTVSRFGDVIMGSGGFIDISQSAKTVVFCGTFTVGDLRADVGGGSLSIVAEGRTRKFVDRVQQITFSGPEALRRGQTVYVVTERAVFELRPQGLTLVEVAPGVELERDVLGQMSFRPAGGSPEQMDPALFDEAPLMLRRRWHAEP